jgi:RNA polymerase sigma-70 factor (ECF subfamily)
MNDAARNRWRRAVAIKTARERDEGDTSGMAEVADATRVDPASIVSLGELKEHVRAAVAQLPEPQRTALLLHRFQGCSYDEVGATLDLSLPAVKSLLFRARENLKQRLLPLLREEDVDELP